MRTYFAVGPASLLALRSIGMTSPSPAIVWFRQDLRLADNPALHRAVESGAAVIPLFILEDGSDGVRAPGGAARWWLHHSLESLGQSLAKAGAPLVLRKGDRGRHPPRPDR